MWRKCLVIFAGQIDGAIVFSETLINSFFFFFFFFSGREMALEGLFPGKDRRTIIENTDLKYPKLGEMLDYIFNQQPALLESAEVRETNLLFPSKTYVAMISFLLNCFEADVEKNNLVESNSDSWPSVEKFCLLLEHALAYEGSAELHANACKALVTVGSHFPEVDYIDLSPSYLDNSGPFNKKVGK